jgi:hypothetical protein
MRRSLRVDIASTVTVRPSCSSTSGSCPICTPHCLHPNDAGTIGRSASAPDVGSSDTLGHRAEAGRAPRMRDGRGCGGAVRAAASLVTRRTGGCRPAGAPVTPAGVTRRGREHVGERDPVRASVDHDAPIRLAMSSSARRMAPSRESVRRTPNSRSNAASPMISRAPCLGSRTPRTSTRAAGSPSTSRRAAIGGSRGKSPPGRSPRPSGVRPGGAWTRHQPSPSCCA